jgi:uncharacterized protein DUF4331
VRKRDPNKEDPTVKKTVLLTVVAALVVFQMLPGKASSHREAPLISQDPMADNTDLYAFVSPDNTDTVTFIANYIPLEQPAGGPNFPAFDDSVLYEIHVDNDGDGKDNVTYQFRFHTQTRNPETFLYNVGTISSLSDPNWNRPQFYDLTVERNGMPGSAREDLGKNLPTPPDNIGPRSTPSYDTLAASAVQTLPSGIKVFAGQRDDPFFVDLGSIFDLAGLRPFNSLHAIFDCGGNCPVEATGHDGVAKFNTHTIALQVPISQLVKPGGSHTIGTYASASRQEVRILRTDGSADVHGNWVQVSRLGHPLINEVVIPLGDKDQWNRQDPENDSQFAQYYLSPEVTRLENGLYAALDNADESGRNDLVAILLTGVPGLNFTGDKRSDLLRVNTDLKPGVNGACFSGIPTSAAPSRLSVIDGDFCGYPNGRRLADDVVDIDLRAFAQGYGSILNGIAPTLFPNRFPNRVLGDGVDANDKPFLSTFPYVAAPWQGYQVP